MCNNFKNGGGGGEALAAKTAFCAAHFRSSGLFANNIIYIKGLKNENENKYKESCGSGAACDFCGVGMQRNGQ